jgi:hypothetical protein
LKKGSIPLVKSERAVAAHAAILIAVRAELHSLVESLFHVATTHHLRSPSRKR